MRVFCFLMVLVWLPAVVLGGEKLVVPEGWDMEVVVYPHVKKGGLKRNVLEVRVSVERVGGVVSSELTVMGWDHVDHVMLFDEKLLEAFYRACDGVEKGYREVVRQPKDKGEVVTVFSVRNGEVWIKQSGGFEVSHMVISPIRGESLRDDVLAGKAAEAWCRELLSTGLRPEETAEKKRPEVESFFLSSRVGSVPGGGLMLEVEAGHSDEGVKPDLLSTFSVVKDGGRPHLLESWDEGLYGRMLEARVALREGREYSFAGDAWYKLGVDPEGKKVQVRYQGFSSASGEFDEKGMDLLEKLMKESKVRAEWLKENEGLFFRREGE